jgi:hypothetical protein
MPACSPNQTPLSSGPWWLRVWVIADARLFRSCRLQPLRSQVPEIPHVLEKSSLMRGRQRMASTLTRSQSSIVDRSAARPFRITYSRSPEARTSSSRNRVCAKPERQSAWRALDPRAREVVLRHALGNAVDHAIE